MSSCHGHAARPARGSRKLFPFLVAALAGLAPGGAALAAGVILHVDTPALTLAPTLIDYENDYVEATGNAGIRLRVKTTSAAGMALLVRSGSASPSLANGDLLLRTLSPPGRGGAALSTYTPLGFANMNLWSTAAGQAQFFYVNADVRIRNLIHYDDNLGAGVTYYSNTLVFTVVSP